MNLLKAITNNSLGNAYLRNPKKLNYKHSSVLAVFLTWITAPLILIVDDTQIFVPSNIHQSIFLKQKNKRYVKAST